MAGKADKKDKTTKPPRAPRASVTSVATQADGRVDAIAADKNLNDGKPHIVRAVHMAGVTYRPGDEEALAEVEGFAEARERLELKGAIVGFPGKASKKEESNT